MEKMRIGIIIPVFPPETYTSATMLRDMAKELSQQNHEVTVLTTFPNRPEGVLYPGYKKKPVEISIVDGYRVIRLWTWFIGQKRRLFNRLMEQLTFAISTARQLWIEDKFDIVIFVPWSGYCAYMISLLLRLKKMSYFYYIMDFMPEQAENVGLIKRGGMLSQIYMWFDQQVCSAAAGILVLSQGFKRHCIKTRGVQENNILLAPIFVNTEIIHPFQEENGWRKEHDIGDDQFIVLFSGTMGYVSGLEILGDVMEYIPPDSNILFICIGEGPLKPDIEKLAQKRSDIICLPFQSDEEYLKALGAANLALLTMQPNCGQGSVPSKMYTYMAAGKPVLSNAPPESENTLLLKQVQCGFIVPPNDPEALAKEILHLQKKPEKLKDAGYAGYRYIQENCTVQSAVANVLQFLGQQLERGER